MRLDKDLFTKTVNFSITDKTLKTCLTHVDPPINIDVQALSGKNYAIITCTICGYISVYDTTILFS